MFGRDYRNKVYISENTDAATEKKFWMRIRTSLQTLDISMRVDAQSVNPQCVSENANGLNMDRDQVGKGRVE